MHHYQVEDCVITIAGCGCVIFRWWFGNYFFGVDFNNHDLEFWSNYDGFDKRGPHNLENLPLNNQKPTK